MVTSFEFVPAVERDVPKLHPWRPASAGPFAEVAAAEYAPLGGGGLPERRRARGRGLRGGRHGGPLASLACIGVANHPIPGLYNQRRLGKR